MVDLLFPLIDPQIHERKFQQQGCVLADPGGSWCLSFALGRPENLRFFVQIICRAPFFCFFDSEFYLFYLFIFFKYNFTFIDKTHITVAKFKTKKKYITILQIGSKLHKDKKE